MICKLTKHTGFEFLLSKIRILEKVHSKSVKISKNLELANAALVAKLLYFFVNSIITNISERELTFCILF